MASGPDLILPIRVNGTRTPLYCVHAISGSAYPYVALGELLPPDQPVFGLEAPGFDTAVPPVCSVQALAERHVATLLDAHGHGPVCLLGWSFGGVVAHEMAVGLAGLSVCVPVLVLVDSVLPAPTMPPDDQALVAWFLTDLLRGAGLGKAEAAVIVRDLPKHDNADAIFDLIGESGSVLADLRPRLLSRRFAVYRDHLRALNNHEPSGRYRGSAVYVQASESTGAALSWRGSFDRLTVHTIPGDHYSIWQSAGIRAVAELVAGSLAETAFQ